MSISVRAPIAVLGLLTIIAGGWALGAPEAFSDFVGFPPSRHFVHDAGAFQLGLGAGLLLATIWVDATLVILAGYLVGGLAHTWSHLVDANLGGNPAQTLSIAVLVCLAAVTFVLRWRELGWVVGTAGQASVPALAPFTRQKTVSLTTYRRDGTPVSTPVSIVVDGDRAYFRTFTRAWKTRRISHNPTVMVAPSTSRGTPTGPAIRATARQLGATDARRAARTLARKYPLLHRVLVPMAHRLGRRRLGRTAHFVLVPDRGNGE